ncbi:hypothetical protein C8J57DRAFT_1512571 [Mycena rebaudengoi]|nr:hypothetical protein C8J57DRAFT_1512571 [Mycena rebaudengoi]
MVAVLVGRIHGPDAGAETRLRRDDDDDDSTVTRWGRSSRLRERIGKGLPPSDPPLSPPCSSIGHAPTNPLLHHYEHQRQRLAPPHRIEAPRAALPTLPLCVVNESHLCSVVHDTPFFRLPSPALSLAAFTFLQSPSHTALVRLSTPLPALPPSVLPLLIRTPPPLPSSALATLRSPYPSRTLTNPSRRSKLPSAHTASSCSSCARRTGARDGEDTRVPHGREQDKAELARSQGRAGAVGRRLDGRARALGVDVGIHSLIRRRLPLAHGGVRASHPILKGVLSRRDDIVFEVLVSLSSSLHQPISVASRWRRSRVCSRRARLDARTVLGGVVLDVLVLVLLLRLPHLPHHLPIQPPLMPLLSTDKVAQPPRKQPLQPPRPSPTTSPQPMLMDRSALLATHDDGPSYAHMTGCAPPPARFRRSHCLSLRQHHQHHHRDTDWTQRRCSESGVIMTRTPLLRATRAPPLPRATRTGPPRPSTAYALLHPGKASTPVFFPLPPTLSQARGIDVRPRAAARGPNHWAPAAACARSPPAAARAYHESADLAPVVWVDTQKRARDGDDA